MSSAHSQTFPQNRSVLNYTLIPFEVDEVEGASTYKLEVWKYIITDSGKTTEVKIVEQVSDNAQIIVRVPDWNQVYTWKVTAYNDKSAINSTPLYRFGTAYNKFNDTSRFKIDVKQKSTTHTNLFIAIDAIKGICDINGKLVWSLPDIEGIIDSNTAVRDIKITEQNTVTFLTSNDAVEIDYKGNLIWRGPNNGKVSGNQEEKYHHEFTRLKNGHYMVAGHTQVYRVIPKLVGDKPVDKKLLLSNDSIIVDGVIKHKVWCASLIEYDSTGKILWSWVSGEHFTDEDLFTPSDNSLSRINTHLNAFYFNEQEKTIYLSYRNINRIMKIAYPSGDVLANYGESYMPTEKIYGTGLFSGQHSCKISKNGYLYLLNNNTIAINNNQGRKSSILVLKEPGVTDTVSKIWEFSCGDSKLISDPLSPGGGSVNELTNNNFLVCLGSNNTHFIVNNDKKIIWLAEIKKISRDNVWENSDGGYRNYPITQKMIEEFIKYKHNLIQ